MSRSSNLPVERFDVVVVPDFQARRPAVFEARTLLFLASWIESGGPVSGLPLHVACIGEPPASVKWLAERAGASVEVHEPVEINSTAHANKLRGFDVAHRTDHLLLLDVDIVVLSDLKPLGALGHCVAASTEFDPRVPQRHWERIYAGAGLPLPVDRMACQRAELDLPRPLARFVGKRAPDELHAMLPYYNSGAVWTPLDCPLREHWESALKTISGLFDEIDEEWQSVIGSDQAGFAVALERLKTEGLNVRRLPDAYNARFQHLYRGSLRLRDVRLYHAVKSFSGLRSIKRSKRRLDRYTRGLWRQIPETVRTQDLEREDRDLLRALGCGSRAFAAMGSVGHRMRRAYARHAVEALKQG